MAINQATKARSHVGGLLVGNGPSSGGSALSPTWIKKFAAVASGTITPGALLTATSVTTTVTVAGAAVGDIVTATPAANFGATGVTWSVYVSAANTVTLVITNGTSGTITPGAGVWTIGWFDIT